MVFGGSLDHGLRWRNIVGAKIKRKAASTIFRVIN
jgi:hypothetical protein